MGVRRDAEHNRRDARAPHFVLFHGPNAFQKEMEASHELRSWFGVQPSGCWAEGTLQRGLRATSDSFKVTLHAKFDVQAINSCGSPSVHRLRSC